MRFYCESLSSFCFSFPKLRAFFLIFSFTGCVASMNSSLLSTVSLVHDENEYKIVAPAGYCVDQTLLSKSKASTTLAVIDCIRVDTGSEASNSRRPVSAVLTATLAHFESVDVKNINHLKELLIRKPGINLLSRANTNAPLKVHKIEIENDILFFLIEQRGSDGNIKQSNFFWRAFFFLNGKIIAMTASNFSDRRDSKKNLENLIFEFAKDTFEANLMVQKSGG